VSKGETKVGKGEKINHFWWGESLSQRRITLEYASENLLIDI
jgi:hypothetical protein